MLYADLSYSTTNRAPSQSQLRDEAVASATNLGHPRLPRLVQLWQADGGWRMKLRK